ncbi:hypothetical protein BDQ17DRAFT_1428130 [Cyathus striatus]|nr:hypothetical protein BDQ17DRAFT_1428130 [Cyathus striatus]
MFRRNLLKHPNITLRLPSTTPLGSTSSAPTPLPPPKCKRRLGIGISCDVAWFVPRQACGPLPTGGASGGGLLGDSSLSHLLNPPPLHSPTSPRHFSSASSLCFFSFPIPPLSPLFPLLSYRISILNIPLPSPEPEDDNEARFGVEEDEEPMPLSVETPVSSAFVVLRAGGGGEGANSDAYTLDHVGKRDEQLVDMDGGSGLRPNPPTSSLASGNLLHYLTMMLACQILQSSPPSPSSPSSKASPNLASLLLASECTSTQALQQLSSPELQKSSQPPL